MAKTVTVRNIPDDIYEGIKREAHLHHRSINNEIIDTFEEKTMSRKIEPEEFTSSVKDIRKRLRKKDVYLTEEI